MSEREGAREAGERALKNTGVRAAAEVVGKLASLALFTILARSEGQSGLGVFVFATAFLQVALVPIDFGYDRYLLREVSRERNRADSLFWNLVALRSAIAVPVLVAAFAAVSLLGYGGTTRATVYVLSVGFLLDILAQPVHTVFNAYERVELVAGPVLLQRVTAAALGIAALGLGLGVVGVAATYAAGSLASLLISVWIWRRSGIPRPRMSIARRTWRRLAGASAPFAIEDVFTVLLFRLDAIILSLMATSAAVGRYGAAYRLIDSTLFITFSLNTAFAPMYAYLGSDTTPTIQSLFQRSIKLALALLVPCAIAFALLAEPLCRLLFGPDFADAAPALRLLAPVAVGVAIVNLCSTLVVSRRNPRTMVLATVPMVAFNVVLNVVLIPRWVESGSAAAMLVTETGFVVVALVLAAYTVRPIHWLRMTGPPLLAGAVMVAPVLLLAPSLVPALAAGGAVYVAAYLAFERLISPVDLAFIAGLARRLAGRVRGMVGAAAP